MLFKKNNLILIAVFLLLSQNFIYSHGVTGKRFFPSTLLTEDPFMSDELSFVFNYMKLQSEEFGGDVNSFGISGEYAKTILPRFGLSVGDNYQILNSDEEGTQSGFGNLEIGAKYQFFTDPVHEAVLSLGLEAELQGTGSKKIADEDYSVISPALYFGKGFGDLNSLDFLKPLAITGQVAVGFPTDNSVSKSLEWGFAVQYSLQYLESFVKDIGLGEPFNRMTVLVEFPMESSLNGNEKTTGYISPGFIWLGKQFQIGVEAQIPINKETGNNVGVVGIFHFFLDDIFPNSIGKPIFN